jgi:hypothetical protein
MSLLTWLAGQLAQDLNGATWHGVVRLGMPEEIAATKHGPERPNRAS